MNKKGMMLSMYAGPFIFGLIVGVIVGIVLLAYLANHGMMDPSMIPV
jgi:hypothetical protein